MTIDQWLDSISLVNLAKECILNVFYTKIAFCYLFQTFLQLVTYQT